jgi:hypothetical protein
VRDTGSRDMYYMLTSIISIPHLVTYPYPYPTSAPLLLTFSSSTSDLHTSPCASSKSPSVSTDEFALWRSAALRAACAHETIPQNALPARKAERTRAEHWSVRTRSSRMMSVSGAAVEVQLHERRVRECALGLELRGIRGHERVRLCVIGDVPLHEKQPGLSPLDSCPSAGVLSSSALVTAVAERASSAVRSTRKCSACSRPC